jgi:hypothetical protein
MKKLLNVFAAALLTFTVTLNANAMMTDATDGLNADRALTNTCYIYIMGRWYIIPC